MQELLPRVRPDDIAKQGLVSASLKSVLPGVLLVRPADGQVLDSSDLVVDDSTIAHGWPYWLIPLLAQCIEKPLEVRTLDDDLFSDHSDLRSRYGSIVLYQPPGCAMIEANPLNDMNQLRL